jgi:hypothetical protein
MPVLFRTVDDNAVGRGQGDYFKVSDKKQRIALVPKFITDASLTPSEQIQILSAKGDVEAQEQVAALLGLKENILANLQKRPPRALRVDGENPGYLSSVVASHMVHYKQGVGYFLCKKMEYEGAGRTPTCCTAPRSDPKEQKEASALYAFVLLVYDDADPDTGEVPSIPEQLQKPIPGDPVNKLDFRYHLVPWAVNDSKMRELKRIQGQFPPIDSDYLVWTEKQGATDRMKANAAGREKALWTLKGDVFKSRVVKEAASLWEGINRTLGRNFSMDEIDQMLTGAAPVQTPKKTTTERQFGALL